VVWDPSDTVCGSCGCIDTDPARGEQGCAIAPERGRAGGTWGVSFVTEGRVVDDAPGPPTPTP
jgi:hypothetical protein